MLLEEIRLTLTERCLLSPSQRIIAAVSGGPDSLCLLHLLWRLGYNVIVAHLDHGLRSESQSDALAVAAIAREMDLPFVLEREDVAGFADRHGIALEEAARQLRYRFLFKQAALNHAQAVLVGHTADDQVETVLMHLLRGAGLSGLTGMDYAILPNLWSQTISLARPLLGVWREQVLAYIFDNGLHPVFDASNLDIRFYRNRLRHSLIPVLEEYNPGIRQLLWRMANTLSGDYEVIQEQVEAAFGECVQDAGNGYLKIHRRRFLGNRLGIRRHIIRRAISLLRPGLRDIDYAAVERTISFFEEPTVSGSCDLIAGLYLSVEAESVWLSAYEADLPTAIWPQLPPDVTFNLDVPGIVRLENGWQLTARVWDISPDQPGTASKEPAASLDRRITQNKDPYQAWFDLDRLAVPIKVRTRRPGDRLQPLGMVGKSIKLTDFMINLKLPRRARPGWPLLCSDDQIAWLPGYRIGHKFRIRPDSRRLVHLILERHTV